MRRLSLPLLVVLFASSVALGQGYQPGKKSSGSVPANLSVTTVTASTSVQTPAINGAGGQNRILLPTAGSTTVKGNATDGASAVGVILDTGSAYAAAGSKIISVKNNGSEKLYVDKDGNVAANNLGGANLTLTSKITKYANVSTAALGVSPTYAYGALTASTTNGATVASYTPAAQGVFEVGGYVNCTAFTSGNVGLQLTYTDCGGVSRSLAGLSGLRTDNNGVSTSNSASATGVGLLVSTVTICANAATITLKTNLGTATADFYAFIRQVN